MTNLLVADEPDGDGTYLLFYVDESGVSVKCGSIWPLHVGEVRRRLSAVNDGSPDA